VRSAARQQYLLSLDGERFLMNTDPTEARIPITLIPGWHPMRPIAP
jgi:hypothetical protein